jgi:hypothetical protein
LRFSGGKVLTTHTLLVPRLKMGWRCISASPLCPVWAREGVTFMYCTPGAVKYFSDAEVWPEVINASNARRCTCFQQSACVQRGWDTRRCVSSHASRILSLNVVSGATQSVLFSSMR